MSDKTILEAAARALFKQFFHVVRVMETDWNVSAEAVLTAVTPLIRAAALEEAGQAAMDCDVSRCDAYMARRDIAVAIHALKEQQQADELDRHTLMGPSSDFNEL